MNKLFTKIASLTLGLALAAGAGAFLGRRAAEGINASEAKAYTLDGTVTSTGSGYAGSNTATQGGISWTINGNLTTNPWRLGGNNSNGLNTAGTIRKVQSSAAVSSENITKVVITTAKPSKNAITPTDVSLKVGTSAGTSTTSSLSNGSWASTITFNRPDGVDWSSKYFEIDFTMPANTTSTNKFIEFASAEFYYESTVARGEVSIGNLTNIINVGDSSSLTAVWDPLDSGATLSSHSFVSDDTDVLSFSGDTYTAHASGKVRITLTAVDSHNEQYEVKSNYVIVTKSYAFEVGDDIVVYSNDASMELTSIDKSGGTHYGAGTAYVDSPNGTLLWNVEAGSADGSFSFTNDGNYLSWSSGNSLTTKTTKDDNSSWYVISYDNYDLIVNVADLAREIWWNSSTPRFACYTGKTPSSTGYNTTNLMKIEEAPVRGTLTIDNSFGNATRQGSKGNLSYTWTPAEGSDATIVSYTWASTNSDVMSVSGDLYEAIGPGKATITLSATDSNGQEYFVPTSDINVVEVVTGSYVKYTSVSDGDTVAIACDTIGTQLSGIANKIGTYVFYDMAPANIYDFTLEASGDYFALKNSEDKYLNWVKDTELSLVDEVGDNALWSITFEDENAIISNKALDGDTHRYLAWNNVASTPRFAAYKTGQTPIQLYGPSQEIVISENGLAFINNLLSYTCDEDGKTAPSKSVWSSLNTQYDATGDDTIPIEDKDLFRTITAVEHASPVTTREKVEQAMAKYDYIVGKYNKTQGLTEDYPDFINRNPAALKNISAPTIGTSSTNTAIIVVSVIAIVSVSSIGVLLVLKRRKNHI